MPLALLALVILALIAPGPVTAGATAPSAAAARAAVRVTLQALPPVVQPGTAPARPSNASSLVASFVPPSPGQPVAFERRTARGWRVVARDVQDAWGSASIRAKRGTYRVRTTQARRTWVSAKVRARAWTAQFEDTFSGTVLDPAVWNSQSREHETDWAPRSCARVDARAHRVGSGVLHLGAVLDPERLGLSCAYDWGTKAGSSPYLLNSQVATEFSHSIRHGIIAARMKPQRAAGMHSAFWMLPQGTRFTDGDPSRGTEIDVMEFFGTNGRGSETIGSSVGYYNPGWTAVRYGGKFAEARKALQPGNGWWDEFHVFSVEWTPTKYVFRVDGREYYRETKAVSQVNQYLVLSMLTADYELSKLNLSRLDDTAQVDWVRVYDAK
jgi:hypothetical protein